MSDATVETSAPAPRPRWWTVPLVALAVLAAATVEWVLLQQRPLVDRMHATPDDAFCHLRIAQEVWRAGRFSFDGIHDTYGFHPLWQLVVAAIVPLCRDSVALLSAVLWLCCALHVCIGVALWSTARACAGVVAGAVASGLWLLNPGVLLWCCCLMENALYALCFVLALRAWLRLLRDPTASHARGLGVWLGLCVLTRISAVFVVAGLWLWHVLAVGQAGGLRRRARHALWGMAVAVAVAAPWYAFAAFHFGSVMPTSGTWKLGTMQNAVENPGGLGMRWLGLDHLWHSLQLLPGYLRTTLAQAHGAFEPWLAALLVGATVAALWRRCPGSPAVRWLGAGALLLALGSAFVNQTMLSAWTGYGVWYCSLEFATVPLLAGLAAAAVVRWSRTAVRCVFAVALLALGGAAEVQGWWPVRGTYDVCVLPDRDLHTHPPVNTQFFEIGLWAGRALPPELRCGLLDPGMVGFISQRTFVSFDPLMNSPQYMALDLPGKFAEVQRLGLSYMFGVGAFVDDSYAYGLPKDTYDVVWVPWPDFPYKTGGAWSTHYMIVRPRETSGPDVLTIDDFPCGLFWPNDKQRRRVITRDRDRLIAGVTLEADALRLQVDVPAAGSALELWIGDAVAASFARGTVGWRFLDLRPWRGQRAQLRLEPGDPAMVCRQAELVDFRWRPDR